MDISCCVIMYASVSCCVIMFASVSCLVPMPLSMLPRLLSENVSLAMFWNANDLSCK